MAEKKKAPRPQDPELLAMSRIDRMLGQLTLDQKRRIIEWVARKNGFACYLENPPSATASFPIFAQDDKKLEAK